MKIQLHKIFFLTLFFFTFYGVQAQYYVSGQDRGSTHWMQIKTESFRVVFPDYAEKQAQILAHQLQSSIPVNSEDIENKAKRIDIVMHMESATSNGMVMWAPKRMEVFNTPSQDLEAHDWWGHLALHEYRHVLQVDKLNQGFTKVLNYLLGQQATGAIVGLYLPLWYVEGDAVVTETKYSNAGRGRNPNFSRGLRAQILDKETYSYDKAYFGSYKDLVPNHYVLGYHMVIQANRMYGEDFWNQHIDFVAKHPYTFFPFAWSLNKSIGMGKDKLYQVVMDSIKQDWQKQMNKETYSERKEIASKQRKAFTNYRFPTELDNGKTLCMRSIKGELSKFILIDSLGKEKPIHTPGYSSFYNVNTQNGKLTWSEVRYHPRWDHVKYNNIMVMDLEKKRVRQITHRKKYFAPQLSPDASKIVCSEVTKENHYALVILDAKTGEVIQKFPSQNFLMMPIWSPNAKKVVAIELVPMKGKRVIAYTITSKEKSNITEPSFEYINRIAFVNQSLVVQASYNGIMNAYALSEDGKSMTQWTKAPFGIEDINQGIDSQLLYCDYTLKGFRIVKAEVEKIKKTVYHSDEIPSHFVSYCDSVYSDSLFNIQKVKPSDSAFEVRKYRKVAHLFQPHSWGPFSVNANSREAKPGLQLTSQNLLGTSVLSTGVEYNFSEASSRYYLEYDYLGWYPEFKLSIDRSEKTGNFIHANGDTSSFMYYQDGAHLDMNIPFVLNKGKFLQNITLSNRYSYIGINKAPLTPDEFIENNFHLVSSRLYMHRLLRKSAKDIDFRRGFTIDLNQRNTLFGKKNNMISGEISIFTPGVWKHHAAKFYFGKQEIDADHLNYSNLINTPRGFTGYNLPYEWSFQFDYSFPIAYPDIKLGPIAYIQRIKGAIHRDMASVNSTELIDKSHYSYGAELTVDGHFFRFVAPIELGFRYSVLQGQQQSSTFVQLIFNVDYNF